MYRYVSYIVFLQGQNDKSFFFLFAKRPYHRHPEKFPLQINDLAANKIK
jgi:hypothetical protein